ncbi:MAG: outer membrane lipoprotein-sorting protein [Nitrospirae bacterium]|nr:outer membrane lipoprotein-sorting protein [Nitrospirota bacterium]
MKQSAMFLLAALLSIVIPARAFAASADEIMKQSQAAFLYGGADFKARVMMKLIDKGGRERVRELSMIRKNFGEPGVNQKYFIYFHQPADVKGMAFLVNKYPRKDDDRWLFIPALNMVRRIAAQDRRSSFVGSDFTYEDISGRDIEDDNHSIVKDERIGAADCHVIKSAPKGTDTDYGHKLSWIDKSTKLPLKEEYYDKRGELFKVFSADEVKNIKGFPTVTKRSIKNLQSGHSSEAAYIKADYGIGVEDGLFAERYLRQPPAKWVE